jgi:ABC-2 type transport system permease protein
MQSVSLLVMWTLWQREMVRFLRQRSRVVGALGTPLVFWLFLGAGVGRSLNLPSGDGMSYLEFSFPGAIGSILMFTAIFSTISIIDDRREGFMQGVLVSPAPRFAVAMGKVLGATTLAVGQGALFLLLAPTAGIPLGAASIAASLGAMTIVALGLTSLGLVIAWRMDSTQGFHAIMNLFLMPMLVLSGAFFPASGAAGWMRAVIAFNPMTYGMTVLRHALYLESDRSFEAAGRAWMVTLIFAAIMLACVVVTMRRDAARAIH